MKFKDFYASDLNVQVLEQLDAGYSKNMKTMLDSIQRGPWSKMQKKRQKSSILPNICLYKSLVELGVSKEEAKELVKKRAFYRAGKAHGVLEKMFHLPGFPKLFRTIMRKSMSGTDFWDSNILCDNKEEFAIDITKCLWKDTCDYFGTPEICEIFCLSDHVVFGNIGKLDFKRNRTLGMEGDKCDFLFEFKKTSNKR